jgi:hypothetical protein
MLQVVEKSTRPAVSSSGLLKQPGAGLCTDAPIHIWCEVTHMPCEVTHMHCEVTHMHCEVTHMPILHPNYLDPSG